MTTMQVFDPAMCCSTGICGPSVDPTLVRFAADLDWLKSQGITVDRFNLSQQPSVFAADADVRRELESKGEHALPLIKVDGTVRSVGAYPTRAELAAFVGVRAAARGKVLATLTVAPDATSGACCTPSPVGAAGSDKKSGCC